MNEEPDYIPWLPTEIEWFLAELIQEQKVAGDQTSLVWVNTILIRATSLEEAHTKALAIGEQYNETHTNTDGDEVVGRFRGLRDLLLIYDKLEDGAELTYEEHENLAEEDIKKLISAKDELGAFVKHDVSKKSKAAV